MSYGIDLSGHRGYTGSFDAPAGLDRKPNNHKFGSGKLRGDSYEARVNRSRKAKLGSRWYE